MDYYPKPIVMENHFKSIRQYSDDIEVQNLTNEDVKKLSQQMPWTLSTNKPNYLKAYLEWYRTYCEFHKKTPAVLVTTELKRDATWPATWQQMAVRKSPRRGKPVERFSPM